MFNIFKQRPIVEMLKTLLRNYFTLFFINIYSWINVFIHFK